ncbi:hypothetical protein METUNv1_01748 [Methyloversatilis universalis FAM5]|uniref:Uncharacterized protein n=1 Tax=Methyloversatilis universalis (strain ATCC BAA-1314 / DSM 25237 / JCM 13912 / CCUG 52030 / FAM5) TaxID=1000565 RepID=F5RBV3_METUF|nr:hypothetical protein METUNv1_01748 [Methyloversatilis universalis FAM5]
MATLTRTRPPGSTQAQAEAVPTRSRNWKQRLHARATGHGTGDPT